MGDRNYLFGLPPMLDAQPAPGKTTSAWLARYGQTLEGHKAGPWTSSVFNGKTAYVHILDWPGDGFRLPEVPRTLVSAASITGNVRVKQDDKGWLLTGVPDTLDTIVRLEFDRSLDEIANGVPSNGSLTAGRERTVTREAEGWTTTEVKLEGERLASRFELTIENPDYLRGHGRPVRLKVQQAGEDWKTVSEGTVYGTICGTTFNPVRANAVRLMVQAEGVLQFDVFEK